MVQQAETPTSHPSAPASPPAVADLMRDDGFCVEAAAAATNRSAGDVRQKLDREQRDPGGNVADEIRRRGVTPFEWSGGMLDFYKESDAFLFELIAWNRRGFKQSMRRWTTRWLERERDRLGRPLRVLCHGDGLGADAATFAAAGHNVTYFEFPGASERFARRLFDQAGVEVKVVTDEASLPEAAFDGVTCFDVLEHVPSPRETVGELAKLLADGGGLVVHAPFYLIHRRYPTHLRANRRYAGSTRLYERAGLTLLDGQAAWNPLAFRKNGHAGRASAIKLAWLRTVGLALKSGRYTVLPFIPIQAALR